ncbi:MAG: response regulator [Thermoguttaceae bacterium]|nr:response regulator [Thermoguttaceae bacterium]
MSEKKNILVVDDDVDFRFQMQTALEAAGFAVTAVAERDEAEKLLLERNFDAAVVDLMLKCDDDGFGLCYHVRQKKPNLPIIIVTSANSQHGIHFDLTTPAEHSWICANTILEKPIRAEQIIGELNDLLDA